MRANPQRSAQRVQIRQSLVICLLFRGQSCKFIPQKVGLNHVLLDEDVIQIYKNKTKTQMKKEKDNQEMPVQKKL